MKYETIFSSFAKVNVLVVGDLMLDSYCWGHVDRISPEAPVPIVTLNKKEYRIGGAGNVALNLVALGANTAVLSIIGDDAEGKELLSLFTKNNIDTQSILSTTDRITTNKTRIISRSQQLVRLDSEATEDISTALENKLLTQFEQIVSKKKIDVVIFEDYNKGVLTERLIKELLRLCKAQNIITAVDPKKKNFLSFIGVDIFKPNLMEIKIGLNLSIEKIDKCSLANMHKALHQILQHSISLITLSEHGVYYQNESRQHHIPCHVRNIADVSGAGDTVIAVASLVYVATKDIEMAAQIANIAGGIVCEAVGTAPVNKEKLLAECIRLLDNK